MNHRQPQAIRVTKVLATVKVTDGQGTESFFSSYYSLWMVLFPNLLHFYSTFYKHRQLPKCCTCSWYMNIGLHCKSIIVNNRSHQQSGVRSREIGASDHMDKWIKQRQCNVAMVIWDSLWETEWLWNLTCFKPVILNGWVRTQKWFAEPFSVGLRPKITTAW